MTPTHFLAFCAFIFLLLLWLDVPLFWHLAAVGIVAPALIDLLGMKR